MALKVVRKERKHRIVSRVSRRFDERVFVMSVLTAAVERSDSSALQLLNVSSFLENTVVFKDQGSIRREKQGEI